MNFIDLLMLRNIRKDVWRSKEELEVIQREKLASLLRHAYHNVPYYKRLFDSVGAKPEDIRSPEELTAIPVLERETLQDLPVEEIISKDINLSECIPDRTGGSMSKPLCLYLTKREILVRDLYYYRSFVEDGLRPTDKRAFILDPHSFSAKRNWYNLLGVARNLEISCFMPVEEQLKLAEKWRPDFIHAYPSSLKLLSHLVADKPGTALRPKILSTVGELMDAATKKVVALAFKANLFDRYAARECGCISWECEKHEGYHINIDSVVVEFLRDGSPVGLGESGDIVLTSLYSYCMPIIRYKIGDAGIPTARQCSCGRGLPLMEVIEGRSDEFCRLPNGHFISPFVLTGSLDWVEGLAQFRIIQEREDAFTVQVVKGQGFSNETPGEIQQKMRKIVGTDVSIELEVKEHIEKERSGKVRTVISKVTGSKK